MSRYNAAETYQSCSCRAISSQGSNQAEHLVSTGWEVYGVARKPQTGIRGVRPVAAGLLEPEALRTALAGIDLTQEKMRKLGTSRPQ